MKIIPKFTLLDQLNGNLDDKNISFTIFDSQCNYHNLSEMAEMHAALPDKFLLELVSFKPSRILEHEIIIALTTTVKIIDLNQDFNQKFALIKQAIKINEMDNIYSTYLDFAKTSNNQNIKLNDNYVPGNFVQNITLKEVKAMIIANNLSNKYLRKIARNKVKEIIELYVFQGYLSFLPEYSPQNRITFTINGPIASGKSSFENVIKSHIYNNYHIAWDEIVKINSDTYKFILSFNYKTRLDGMNIFSQLVHEESCMLQQMISERLMKKLQENAMAPNVFFDKVFIHQDNINFALYGGGKLKGIIVSAPVEDALVRAQIRGDNTGRYEDSNSILTSHASISTKFINLLDTYKGEPISYLLFNTKEVRKKIAEIDLENHTITICNHNDFIEFIEKSKLDIIASLEKEEVIYNEINMFNHFIEQLDQYQFSNLCKQDFIL